MAADDWVRVVPEEFVLMKVGRTTPKKKADTRAAK
jgi:hypothetical protein